MRTPVRIFRPAGAFLSRVPSPQSPGLCGCVHRRRREDFPTDAEGPSGRTRAGEVSVQTTERRVYVQVGDSPLSVGGERAELVVLAAAGDLSPRTLRLLLEVALAEPRLVGMEQGRIVVDLGAGTVRVSIEVIGRRVAVNGGTP